MKKYISKKLISSLVCLLVILPAVAGGDSTKSAEEATITSDQMELIDNGAKTIFTGHVVLQQAPYIMTADLMTRYKATDTVEAEGHIVGTWLKSTGEKTVATGGKALYVPKAQTTELWESPRLTHWESAKDVVPTVVTAERFIAHHDTQMMFARQNVIIQHGNDYKSTSDEAQLDQKLEVLHLWGKRQTTMDWKDRKGSGHFLSDRALLFMSPKRARLMDHVTGHVVPDEQ